jgi:hypothetical protein
MAAARSPLVYLDACCFGIVAQRTISMTALHELNGLLRAIELGELRFAASAWLETELAMAQPASRRRRLLSLIPPDDLFVPWNKKLGREAESWVSKLGLENDGSGVQDCRHVACALAAGADYLITHDNRFFEAMRQHAILLKPLKPVQLMKWRSIL